MNATKRALVGRKIIAVDFRPFDDGKGGKAHDPVITLDNGRRVFFITEESESGDYGTKMLISDPRAKP
jgi:hypothetical protein